MKMRYITKEFSYGTGYRRTKPGEQLFQFSLKVYQRLNRGKIDSKTLSNFKKVLQRIVGSDKEYDGYIYYPLDSFKTLRDLAYQIHYCSDRWCAGRAASIIVAIDKCLAGKLIPAKPQNHCSICGTSLDLENLPKKCPGCKYVVDKDELITEDDESLWCL